MNAERLPRLYSSGATHRYLGRQYRLKVNKGDSPGIKLTGGYFHVTTKHGSEAEVENLIAFRIRERASEQFARRVDRWRDWCEHHRLPSPQAILRSMPKRWGSAHRDKRIALNPELVRAPSVCIDYVIAHEVCHLKHPNHGPDFYRQLDELVPDWRRTKRRLEQTEL
jgi:predicted metal-dependent hydrolase